MFLLKVNVKKPMIKQSGSQENWRKAYTQKQFDKEFAITTHKDTFSYKNKLKRFATDLHPRNLISVFTVINLVTEYDFKKNLIPDVLSGLTVGIMQIPTGKDLNKSNHLNYKHKMSHCL